MAGLYTMRPEEAEAWKSTVLDEVFKALATSKQIGEALVFKGARVLNVHLPGGRQSLDLDSNLRQDFIEKNPDYGKIQSFLEEEFAHTIRQYFERQNLVRYELTRLKVRRNPPNTHPLGWDAFKVRINVLDNTRIIPNLPALDIDIAAPESLLEQSVSAITVGQNQVYAYTLERIAGEKLRAFLSSLPRYCTKISRPRRAVRAKDLYDLARIRNAHPIVDKDFWYAAGQEFRLACSSRFIDCKGIDTFKEDWEVTKQTYSKPIIPKDIPFAEVENTLMQVIAFFEKELIIPFTYPLPSKVD